MTELIIPVIISCLIAFFAVYLTMPPLIKYLNRKNLSVRDIHKKGEVMVVRPGGPALIIGVITSEIVLYGFLQLNEILAIIITTFIAFL
ncbi:MAG: UDP-N-acetylglucosamine-1-phosphate transferase, partial [Nitrosopumilaceae archaeon]|nr:UDP-N-acetylglucosamine-1-phosphate transferase [Nitrosopumilaceae archaeon]